MPKSRTSRPELILLYIHFHFCSWIALCFLRVFFANQILYSSVFRYWTLFFFNDLKKLFKYFFISVFNYICIFFYMHPNQVLRKKWIEFGSIIIYKCETDIHFQSYMYLVWTCTSPLGHTLQIWNPLPVSHMLNECGLNTSLISIHWWENKLFKL